MHYCLQDVLLDIPLTQLSFLTVLPKEIVQYEAIIDFIPDYSLEKPTLMILEHAEEWDKLNEKAKTIRLIQDPNFVGLILCGSKDVYIQEEVGTLFLECGLPMIQLYDSSRLSVFQQTVDRLYPFSQASVELQEFMQKGFIHIAEELAEALQTPFLYFNHLDQLLWQTGDNKDLLEAMRCFNLHRRKLGNRTDANLTMEIGDAFQVYTLQISEGVKHSLLTSSQLANWQKRMIDKLVGLTAISLQTKEIFDEQQNNFKDHFIYDLLYHKFESKKVLVKQGKIWGWNLERPHHLIIVNIGLNNKTLSDLHWLDEFVFHIETEAVNLKEPLIVFPFQDQVIILLEDAEMRINCDRKNYVVQIVNHLEASLTSKWADVQINIGIGRWYQDTINLNKSYQEAKLALKFGKDWFGNNRTVFHINDLGVVSLLIHTHNELLLDFSKEYLSSLIESDQENGTEYIKTLQVYFQYDEKINEVSELLFVHPNTLRKRLRRIEEITGLQLQDSDDLMTLTIAVRILSFVK